MFSSVQVSDPSYSSLLYDLCCGKTSKSGYVEISRIMTVPSLFELCIPTVKNTDISFFILMLLTLVDRTRVKSTMESCYFYAFSTVLNVLYSSQMCMAYVTIVKVM